MVRLLPLLVLTSCVVPDIDWTGRVCSTSCPTGWDCIAGTCARSTTMTPIEDDGGTGFCATHRDATRCDAFDTAFESTPALTLEITGSGRATRDDVVFASPPASLYLSVRGNNGDAWAYLRARPQFDGGIVTLDAKIRSGSTYAGIGFLAVAEYVCRGDPPTGAWLHWTRWFDDPAAYLYFRTDGNKGTRLSQTFDGGFQSVRVEADRETGVAAVWFDGVKAGEVTIPTAPCPGADEINIGVNTKWDCEMWLDDVVLRHRPK